MSQTQEIPEITVIIDGGVVQNVVIPGDMPAVRVTVRDYDVTDDTGLPIDSDGDPYEVCTYDGGTQP